MKPRLLDLFCGAGGAAMGYHRAGFEVVGVDIEPQPHYPFEFHQADAMTYPLEGFDAIHASPPCQAYSTASANNKTYDDLYEDTRDRLDESGLPYAIENVIGAPYLSGIVLCGSMFDLKADGEWLRRHRNFETPFMLMQPQHHHRGHANRPITITGDSFAGGSTKEYVHSREGTFDLCQRLMDIDWMTRKELAQAIPPAYTEFIGSQLLQHLNLGSPANE